MDITKGTPIRVTWLDADCEAGWLEHTEEEEIDFLESYGVFYSLGPKFLILSFCHNNSADDFLGKHRIPRGMVQHVDVLTANGERYTV